MDIFRKVLLVFTGGLFALTLWLLAVDIGLVKTFGNAENVKRIVAGSGVYNDAIPSVFEQIEKDQTQPDESGGVPLTDPIIKASAQEAFSPQFLQTSAENMIDSLYDWLEGKTQTPQFNVDIEPAKTTFANLVAGKLEQRLAGLPACPAGTQTENFDFYNATCLPRGFSATSAAQQVKAEINNSQEFLNDTSVTPDDVKAAKSNQSIFEGQLKDAPKFFGHFKRSPVYLAVLAALLGLFVILLSQSRRRGVRRIGITLLVIGIVVLIFSALLNSAGQRQSIKVENKVLSERLNTLTDELSNTAGSSYVWLGSIYTALGLAAVLGTIFLARSKHESVKSTVEAETQPAPPPEIKSELAATKPAVKPKAKPAAKTKPAIRKIKIE